MNNVELCSIISNPLQNAIEALNGQSQGERYLRIQMKSTNQNFKIEICNSLSTRQIAMTDGLPRTRKKDKENHGFGLKNVKNLVEKYNGLFNIQVRQNEFMVTLILPVNN